MSLGLGFDRRRMMAAAEKGPKYVWAVYAAEEELIGGTTETASVRNNNVMVATGYTYSGGVFTLVNAQSKIPSEIAEGGYMVALPSSSSTSTSGSVLYVFKSYTQQNMFSGSLTYVKYTGVGLKKGETELYRIESDTADYPMDGEQDGLWYIMLKGERETYVWDVFNITEVNGYTATESDVSLKYTSTDSRIYVSDSYTINQNTGAFGLGSESFLWADLSSSEILSKLKNRYHASDLYINLNNQIFYGASSVNITTGGSGGLNVSGAKKLTATAGKVPSKGTATGGTVQSQNTNDYPQDGVQGSYWYTYSHSYTEEFDDR